MDDLNEEAFDEFIVFDDGSDSEKENEATNVSRQPKTTQIQFEMIIAFMECNNEELLDKKTFASLWENLAAKLNDVGPPEHTVSEWKKIWSVYKYYKNRKRSSGTPSLHTDRPRKQSRLDQTSEASENQSSQVIENQSPQVKGAAEVVCTVDEGLRIHSELLARLDVIIANQNAMLININAIVEVLKEVLQSVARKA